MLTLDHKRTLLALLINSKFNLSPQEMSLALQAIDALAKEVQTESEGPGPTASPKPKKGAKKEGDPAGTAGD